MYAAWSRCENTGQNVEERAGSDLGRAVPSGTERTYESVQRVEVRSDEDVQSSISEIGEEHEHDGPRRNKQCPFPARDM